MPTRLLAAELGSGGIDQPQRGDHPSFHTAMEAPLHCAPELPNTERVLRHLRQQAVVDECLNRGLTIADAAAKFRLSVPHVKRILGRHLGQQRDR